MKHTPRFKREYFEIDMLEEPNPRSFHFEYNGRTYKGKPYIYMGSVIVVKKGITYHRVSIVW